MKVIIMAALTLGLTAPGQATAEPPAVPQCSVAAAPVEVAELPEGSGLAASRLHPGRFWSHNDSGGTMLFALDANGAVTGRVQLSGAGVKDWEAIAAGPCPTGSCVYVADIGDNDARRTSVTIYRVPEPAAGSTTAKVDGVFHASYPDGPHDAEAILVTPEGRLHIVTKGETGPVSIYRFPADLRTDSTMPLERVGNPREAKAPAAEDRVTDGAVSPDGQWAVLRTSDALIFYRTADLLSGQWREAGRATLGSLGEPQGEGVTFGPDGALFLMGEGGSKKMPGTFARLSCTPGLK